MVQVAAIQQKTLCQFVKIPALYFVIVQKTHQQMLVCAVVYIVQNFSNNLT